MKKDCYGVNSEAALIKVREAARQQGMGYAWLASLAQLMYSGTVNSTAQVVLLLVHALALHNHSVLTAYEHVQALQQEAFWMVKSGWCSWLWAQAPEPSSRIC